MNIEVYNLDSLRKLVRGLQDENKRLKKQLEKANIPYESENYFEEKIENIEDYDPDQGGRILHKHITEELAKKYFAMFWGRIDVYAQRGSKGGYFPQCNNRWKDNICPKQRGEKLNCEVCEHTEWIKLTPNIIVSHLLGYKENGSDVIGVYPLLADGTCRFLVFDFDNHEKGAEQTDFANTDDEWHDEVDALRLMCESNGITPLVERSRSGRGAHVWIFFKKPVSASIARNFGFLLLDKGSASINLKSFHYYDRMYPSQYVDTLNLMPRIQNQIRSMAAFDNPVFYKNKRLGYSNYYNFSAIYMGKDADGYISIPRGLRDNLISSVKEAGIEYDIEDHREKGRPIRVSFNGDLRTQQDLAEHRLLAYDYGVLNAATAFGKTVVCSYLIYECTGKNLL